MVKVKVGSKARRVLLVYLVLILGVLLFSGSVVAVDYWFSSSDEFEVFCPQGISLIFQLAMSDGYWVGFEPISGDLNGTDGVMWTQVGASGEFSFVALESCTLNVSIGDVSALSVFVEEDSGSLRVSHEVDAGENVTVSVGEEINFTWMYDVLPPDEPDTDLDTYIGYAMNAILLFVVLLGPAVGLMVFARLGIYGFAGGFMIGGVLAYILYVNDVWGINFPAWALFADLLVGVGMMFGASRRK